VNIAVYPTWRNVYLSTWSISSPDNMAVMMAWKISPGLAIDGSSRHDASIGDRD
jgi:hypothetical protein